MKVIFVDAVNTFVIKGQGVFQKMYSLLEQYPNDKIVLTNANDEQMKTFGFDSLPYKVFTLKHNPEKTDPKYYQTLLKELHLSAQECIYFEHNLEAVQSAQSVGIQTYHYNPELKDLSALQEFLDTNL